MTNAIEASALVKSFGSTRALDGLDLSVPRGSIYGLLGPNGAGKTTAIRLLATLLRPDGGSAYVLGHDVVREASAVRASVTLTGQFASVDEDLTGFENLVLVARLFGLTWGQARRRSRDLLDAFGLTAASGRQVRHYSGGMHRRLDIAASLVVTPELLFLDEPTTGLDPRSRNQVWEIVRAIAAEGTTVLLTTQYLEEADRLADRLAVIDSGRVIAEGRSRELKRSVGGHTLHLRLATPRQVDAARLVLHEVVNDTIQAGADELTLTVRVDADDQAPAALAALSRDGIAVSEFALAQPTLDDVFFALTGHAAEAAEADTDD